MGNWKWEIGNGKLEMGIWKWEFGICHFPFLISHFSFPLSPFPFPLFNSFFGEELVAHGLEVLDGLFVVVGAAEVLPVAVEGVAGYFFAGGD